MAIAFKFKIAYSAWDGQSQAKGERGTFSNVENFYKINSFEFQNIHEFWDLLIYRFVTIGTAMNLFMISNRIKKICLKDWDESLLK